jgi:hypothetical protein
MTIGRTDDPANPLGATAYEAASVFGSGSRIPSGPAVTAPRRQAGHMNAVDPPVSLIFLLHPRGRSLIAPPLSIASCLLCLPCRGHGSLRGRKAPPQHLVRSAAAAMSTAGSHDASRGPRPSVAADCTLAPSGNRHIRKVVRMNSRCWSYQVLATGCSDQRNGSPERHMLCKITESFRASATRALPAPDRLAIA